MLSILLEQLYIHRLKYKKWFEQNDYICCKVENNLEEVLELCPQEEFLENFKKEMKHKRRESIEKELNTLSIPHSELYNTEEDEEEEEEQEVEEKEDLLEIIMRRLKFL